MLKSNESVSGPPPPPPRPESEQAEADAEAEAGATRDSSRELATNERAVNKSNFVIAVKRLTPSLLLLL